MSVHIDAVAGQLVIKDEVFDTIEELCDFIERVAEGYELTGVVLRRLSQ